MLTLSMVRSGCHSTLMMTSVSTEGGNVIVQVRVCDVPSYSEPLGILRVTFGVGTAS